MILAMISDLRVVLVKLADRLHNMRTLEYLPSEKRREISRETMDIYAPIANRLGHGTAQGRARGPGVPEPGARGVRARPAGGRSRAEGVGGDDRAGAGTSSQKRLAEAGIAAEVTGRQKRLYSIASKMRRRGVDVAQLHDLIAFRIVAPDTRDCYAALGLVHQLWRPVPGRIKDYIAMPKPNFYQSLHTTVISESGTTFEVQIRTREMDLIGERGIAAHWKYKEGRLDPRPDDTPLPMAPAAGGLAEGGLGPAPVPVVAQGGPLSRRGLHVHAQGPRLRLPARGDAHRLRLPGPHGHRAPLRRGEGQRQARARCARRSAAATSSRS